MNTTLWKTILFLISICLLAISCCPQVQIKNETTTSTTTNSNTEQQTTPTPTESFIASAIPEASNLHEVTFVFVDHLPDLNTYEGYIVLGGYAGEPGVILNISTGELLSFPNAIEFPPSYHTAIISPDQKEVAYTSWHNDQSQLLVVNIHDEIPNIELRMEEDGQLLRWVDEQSLLLQLDTDTYKVIDTLTGSDYVIGVNLPNRAVPVGVAADYYGQIFSPDMTRVVYLGDGEPEGYIVLWDLENNQKVKAFLSENNPYGGEPVWSFTGEKLILSLDHYDIDQNSVTEELYLVTKDGDIHAITHLSDKFSNLLSIRSFSWSPDDSKVAFWFWYVEKDGNDGARVAVADLITKDLVIYELAITGFPISPVWSPDGKALVVQSKYLGETVTLLLDLQDDYAYVIAGQYRPIGWIEAQ